MALLPYYTGAKIFNQPQLDSSQSLGGFISSSIIPNGMLSNLFGSLSRYTIQNGKSEIRAFVLYNSDTVDYTNIKCFFTYPDNSPSTDAADTSYDVGFATVVSDNCGDLSIEKLSSVYSQPYSVTLYSGADSLMNALDLPDIAKGTYLGIFIRRNILVSAQQPRSDQDYLDLMNGVLVLPTQEDIGFTVNWNP